MKTSLKKSIVMAFAGLSLLAGSLYAQEAAAFTPPTAEQIAAAATNPDLIAGLLAGATPEQAAAVVRDVIGSIVAQGLPARTASARIQAVVQSALAAVPPAAQTSFVQQLGALLRASSINTTAVMGAVSRAVAITNPTLVPTLFQTPPPLAQPYGGQS
jgi:hypothetical protein